MRPPLPALLLALCAVTPLGCLEEPEPIPDVEKNTVAYGPCSDIYSRILCLELEDVCISDGPPALNFACGASCPEGDLDACPQAPASGDAVVVCDSQDTCALSCGGSLLCPDGMSCIANFCLWPTP